MHSDFERNTSSPVQTRVASRPECGMQSAACVRNGCELTWLLLKALKFIMTAVIGRRDRKVRRPNLRMHERKI